MPYGANFVKKEGNVKFVFTASRDNVKTSVYTSYVNT